MVIVLVFCGLEIELTMIVPEAEEKPVRRVKTASEEPPRFITETFASDGVAYGSFEEDPELYDEPAKRTI